ncbi:Transmembrane domain-containing protein [Spironucleus salmonicida]|uniref:Transmembrane domain-containing protein n=1 Tax=Spironucleus salmonicida TaxID=348837 RepID=V6LP02_9EUKA|nr:Transmembrane domain-containing protein [Spironucleus salmonicida]|eukprot:EST46330.1 Transmembrane domain-containing protein [Spironucleus salmonicida]
MDEFSDSGGSSSSASRTTKHSISREIKLLGEDPPLKSTIMQFLLTIPSQLLPAVSLTITFMYVSLYCAMANAAKFAFLQPFFMILTQNLPASLAQSCSNSANKNIVAGQYAAGNIYFAYFFFASFILNIFVMVLGFTVLKPLYTDESSSFYVIVMFCVAPFCETLTNAVDKFYEVENRMGLVTLRQLVSACILIGVNPFIMNYFTKGDLQNRQGLYVVTYSYLINYGVLAIWNIVVIGKMKLMNVEYFGFLKFSMKRLRPFRPKFLLNIFVTSLSSMLVINIFPLSVLVVTFILYYIPTTNYDLNLLYVKNMIVIITHAIIMSIHESFSKSFFLIASYNIGIKKLTRTYKYFIWHIIFDIVFAFPVVLILAVIKKPFSDALIPNQVNLRRSKDYELDQSQDAVLITALCTLFGLFMQLSNSMLQIEGKQKLAMLIQIPSIIFVSATPFISLALIGQSAPLYQILAIIELINFSIGLPMVIFYGHKYKNLSKAEILKNEQLAKQDITSSVVDEIRLTVTNAFLQDGEEEDQNQARQKSKFNGDIRLTMTNREKTDKLRTNTQFISLARQFGSSMAGPSMLNNQSINIRESIADDRIRASQLTRDSVIDDKKGGTSLEAHNTVNFSNIGSLDK